MPRISDHGSELLDATMVDTGDVVVILDAGKWVSPEETGFKNWVFHIKVRLSDQRIKTMSMNKTTRKSIASVHGDSTESWINKEVVIEVARGQKTPSGIKDVLYGKPAEQKPPQPTPTKLG